MNASGPTPVRNDLPLALGVLGALAVVNVILIAMGKNPMDARGLGVLVAAGITLSMYSFLYRDNVLFKAAEHLYVGVSAGYTVIIAWYQVIVDEYVLPTREGDYTVWAVKGIPLLLGFAVLMRISRKFGWVSRYAFAFLMGFYSGLAIPVTIDGLLLRQIEQATTPLWGGDMTIAASINTFLLLIGLVSVLVYFFYSVEHKGPVGAISKVGIYFLMISFGASFGYTVMARLSLLIGQLFFLLSDWLHVV